MRYEMSMWDKGRDIFLARLAAGAWRHGIATEAAMKEIAKESKRPYDINDFVLPRQKNKDGDMRKVGQYYYTQASMKNVYYIKIGKSGDPYRVRRFYCVPHGTTEDETDENGKRRPPPKAGLWLRFEDLNPIDIRYLVRRYRIRETDSAPTKKYIWTAQDKSAGLPNDTRMEDIMDDILGAM